MSESRKDSVLMVVAVLAACAVSILWGERIAINQGQGWDGIEYVRWARDFPAILHKGLTAYHSQRVLPSMVVYEMLELLGIPHTTPNIIYAFAILNTVALAATAAIWGSLARHLALSRPAAWLGFVALFASHANLKHALYYPTLTDPTAFALGAQLVWSYLTSRPIVLWVTTLAGVITWPALPPLGLALLVLPRPSQPPAQDDPHPRVRVGASLAVSLALACVFWAVADHYLNHPVRGVGDEKFAAWVLRDWLPVTLIGLVGMLTAGWFVLLRAPALWHPLAYVRGLKIGRSAIAIVAAAAILAARAWWIAYLGRNGEGPTGAQFLCEHTLGAIRGPLWGPVHHVVYFGPIILVAILRWNRIARTAATWGPAAVLALALAVAFAGGANSRQWNHLVPFVVVAAVVATQELWTAPRVAAFAVLSTVWSKVWFTLGYDRPLNFHEFPNQRYFMNHGPYASDTMFVVHLACALVTGACVWRLLRDVSRSPES